MREGERKGERERMKGEEMERGRETVGEKSRDTVKYMNEWRF